MSVIGFLTYEDFRNEIRDASVRVVRMQDYDERRTNHAGIPEVRVWLELSAVNGDGVYVARFPMGGGWDVDMESEQAKLRRAQENVAKARGFLQRDLEAIGVTVRPGIVAGTQEAKVSTTPPWKWEKDETGLPALVTD